MRELWLEYVNQIPLAIELLVYAYGIFVVSWPLFLLLERLSPVTPRTEYLFNWKIVASNFALTPLFYALVIALTTVFARGLGLPPLAYPVFEWSSGFAALDLVVQGSVLFLVACFMGDFWYYWWHRAQHEWPWL